MSYALNNVTTQDRYVDATTLQAPGSARVNLQVSNAAVYWQRGARASTQGGVQWDPTPEEFLLPGSHSFDRRCDAVRVRSTTPGKPAQVTVTATPGAELGGPPGA